MGVGFYSYHYCSNLERELRVDKGVGVKGGGLVGGVGFISRLW